MATPIISESKYRTVKQTIQNRHVKFLLLNNNLQTLDELSGNVISGSFTVDANADIRRTGSLDLVVTDSTFEVEPGGRIWLDRLIQVFVGNEDLFTGQIDWVNLGIYIIDAPSYKYSIDTNTLTLTLLDLMARMTGTRNGYLPGIPTVISAGENIRSAIISTLKDLGGFSKYICSEAPSPGTVPIELKFEKGSTVYDILVGLKDIYPNYEIFFDVDGVFHYQPIPTGKDELVYFDDDLWNEIEIDESINVDFANVKNAIEVYGRTHNPTHYSTATTISGSTVQLTIASVTEYTEELIYGFTTPKLSSPVSCSSLQIGSLGTKTLKDEAGKTPKLESEIYYCAQYKSGAFVFLGRYQAYGYAEDNNPQSPFYVKGTLGKILIPLYDGEYSNCLTDDLAKQRAEYELYLHTRMNDSIDLTCVPAYFLDVNILVNFSKKDTTTPLPYLIKSINFGLGPEDSMSINMIRYYPAYPT